MRDKTYTTLLVPALTPLPKLDTDQAPTPNVSLSCPFITTLKTMGSEEAGGYQPGPMVHQQRNSPRPPPPIPHQHQNLSQWGHDYTQYPTTPTPRLPPPIK